MFPQFALRRVATLLGVLFVAIQIPATAIADPAAASHAQNTVNGEAAGFSPITTSPESSDQPFGLTTATTADDEIIGTWQSVAAGIRVDHEILVRCQANEDCQPAAQHLLKIVAEGRQHSGRAQIGVINRAINLAIQPSKAFAEPGLSDPWNSPLESLAVGQGDCRNYAVVKYLALLEVGITAADIRLVIVHDRVVNEDHAVVTIRLNQHWLVLDNRWLALAQDTELPRFVPLFALEQGGIGKYAPALVKLLTPRRVASHAYSDVTYDLAE